MNSIRRNFVAATIALALLVAANAHAAPITIAGGTAGTIPGSFAENDFVGLLFPGHIGGYFGAQITFSLPEPSTVLFEYFGAEAGYHNEFNYAGTERFDHSGGTIIASSLNMPLASYLTPIAGSGTLPFRFDVNNDAAFVTNGSNPNDSGGLALGPNFFATCDPRFSTPGSGGTNCSSVYLFLDDGGAGPDDNHDDFLVRITVNPVPEPLTLGMLGIGLFGLVGFRFRS